MDDYSMFISIGFISSSSKEVVAFVRCEETANVSDSLPELVICPCRDLSDERLEF